MSWLAIIARCERDESVSGHLVGRRRDQPERLNGRNKPFFGNSVENEPSIPIVNQGIFIANQGQDYHQPGYLFRSDSAFSPKLLLIRSRDTGAEGPARKLHREGDRLCAKPMELSDTLRQ